uniref:TROVE domain-containing protein n=1 Tax=Labrus bergylta TaxID=56723 RepID=A0A3Q3EKU1_9LABR
MWEELSSNYAPPCLENKLLTQTSTLMPPLLNLAIQPSSCPALQPSALSSTSSSLLSTSSVSPSLTSSLLSTENKLLESRSPLLSFSLTSHTSVPHDSLLPASLSSGRFAHPSSFLTGVLGGEEKRGDEGSEETSEVAVYTRQELNIRITANFLLALAANQPSTKSHVRRYFCSAVQLPSDWLEVVRIYSTVSDRDRSLPMCLKKAMSDKFKQFNEYQLAKYNTRKHRCKHSRNKPEGKVQKHSYHKAVVDKKQSEFSMKKMIKKLHIKEPADHVMAILGKKYPADPKIFSRSGIKGAWDRERAGQRMKLKEPETWERLLSQEGNKAATWEKLIDNKSLPFMAMLRNLRNMITKGISEAHHKKILDRLTNKTAVIQSRQFPFRFLAAYKVVMQLQTLGEILLHLMKVIKIIKHDYINLNVTVLCVRASSEKLYTVELLDRYRKALETAVQVSCRYNVPPLPGRTVILMSAFMSANTDTKVTQDFSLFIKTHEGSAAVDCCTKCFLVVLTLHAFVSQIDNIIILTDNYVPHSIEWIINRYRMDVNNKALLVKILFSDRFVAERGSSRLLEHVEHLDKLYNIPPPEGAKDPQNANNIVQISASPKLRWRGVRVFISSTFRDMHSERDILVQSVFPELRRRAAQHCLYLQEVELRWGVTEEESERATELCLSEVCRSQMMVGVLGERYGLVPPKPVLPDLPQYSWLASAPAGLSVTEMEIRQFEALYPNTCFMSYFYFVFLRSVPVAWRSHFAPESKEAESKMVLFSTFKCRSYQSEWGGVVGGKPYLKNLEDFGKAVLEDLWTAVVKQFVEVSYLSDMKKKTPLVLLVDGVDLVQDGRGQLCSDWIPQQLPQGVCLVVSIPSKAALLQTLAKRRGTVLFSLGQLTMLDRKEIVQKGLDSFGKKLSDSAFNNQVPSSCFSLQLLHCSFFVNSGCIMSSFMRNAIGTYNLEFLFFLLAKTVLCFFFFLFSSRRC